MTVQQGGHISSSCCYNLILFLHPVYSATRLSFNSYVICNTTYYNPRTHTHEHCNDSAREEPHGFFIKFSHQSPLKSEHFESVEENKFNFGQHKKE